MLCKHFIQYLDEEIKDVPTSHSVAAVKVEPAEHSGASTPNSPITPQDESELKPILTTANSTTDQERIPDASNAVAVAEPDAVCTSRVDSTQFSKDLSSSLSECLVEINVSVGSGTNTPSPCPSTAGISLQPMANWAIFTLLIMTYENHQMCLLLQQQ